MNWGMQELEFTQAAASAALTAKRYNVQLGATTRDRKVRPRVKGVGVPALTTAMSH